MAWTRLPMSSSGRPITAHERTAGCSCSAASTSAGYTFAPPVRIMSVDPVAEVEVAVGVEPAVVAERLPPAVARPGLRADVAVGGGVAAGPQPHLALLAGRQLVAVGVADHDLAADRPADRAAVLEPLACR